MHVSPLPAGNAAQGGKAQFFLSATLAQTFNNRSSALTGAALTPLANPLTFIASGAAVGFIRCSLLFFKGTHGLVVPPRHWYFFPTEKGLGPAAMSGMKLYMLGNTKHIENFVCHM